MTAGESATPDFDFESFMHKSGVVDPGVTEYLRTVKSAEKILHQQGGVASQNYESALRELNNDWPQQDGRAKVVGRIYLFGNIIDEDVFEDAVSLWGIPIKTETSIYWDVVDADVVSRGIVDAGDEDINFVCSFALQEGDVPSFICHPGEAAITYDRRTKEAGELFLRREWGDVIEFTEAILPDYLQEVEEIPRIVNAIVDEFSDALYAHEELCYALSEFVTYRINFNQTAAYMLVLRGGVEYHDNEGVVHKLDIGDDRLEYVYRPTIVFTNKGDNPSGLIVASAGDGSHNDEILITPLSSVSVFKSTFSGLSLLDSAGGSELNHYSSDATVEHIDDEEPLRVRNLNQLRNMQSIINQAIYYAKQVNQEECVTEEDAKESAETALYNIQHDLDDSNLEAHRLVIEGDGVVVSSSRYTIEGLVTEKLTIAALDEPSKLELSDRRSGYYVDIFGSYAEYEQDDNDEDVIKPMIYMQVQVGSQATVASRIQDVPGNELVIRSFASVPLDGSASIVVERLDIEETIDAALDQLADDDSTDIIEQFDALYEVAMTFTGSPVNEAGIELLHSMSEYCNTQSDDVLRKALLEALAGMFNDKVVALNTTQDQTELVQGTIVDVKFETSPDFPPVGLVFTLAADDGSIHQLPVESVQTAIMGGYL